MVELRNHLRRVAAAALALASIGLAGCAQPAHRCDSPKYMGHGTWSSYVTGGTMPSGTTRVLSDGDRWTCSNGVVTVH